MTPCKFRGTVVFTPWPVLLLSSWLQFIFEKTNASMLCNGLPPSEQWYYELKSFWELFRTVMPHHEIYRHPERLPWTLPFMYHGDEGRGRMRRAVLVTSFQPMLAWSGHSFKSRLLCSLFPGERYTCIGDEETLESLHAAVARDLRALFDDGLEVSCDLDLRYHMCKIDLDSDFVLWKVECWMLFVNIELHVCVCGWLCLLLICFAGEICWWVVPKNLHCMCWCQRRLAVAKWLCFI